MAARRTKSGLLTASAAAFDRNGSVDAQRRTQTLQLRRLWCLNRRSSKLARHNLRDFALAADRSALLRRPRLGYTKKCKQLAFTLIFIIRY